MNVSYEAREGYLYIKVTGELDPSTARDDFLEWIGVARSLALNRVLCDITLLTGFDAQQVSTITQFDMSIAIAKSLPRNFILAILETPEQLEENHFTENVMVNRGVNVKVTSKLDEAFEWLGVTPKGIREIKPVGKERPAQSQETPKPHERQ